MQNEKKSERLEQQGANDVLSLSGLAEMLRLDKRTITRLVDRGELPKPCLSEGGAPRWLKSYVIRFMIEQHESRTKRARKDRSKLN